MKNLSQLIQSRYSCREYLEQPIEPKLLQQILTVASASPSGGNIQPWQVSMVSGESLQRLTSALCAAFDKKHPQQPDYPYYPNEWLMPWDQRRRDCGKALYQALGVEASDKGKRIYQWRRNFQFFAAPSAIIISLDKSMAEGAMIDIGLFMQSLMLAATAAGLATCPQASIADYPQIIRDQLDLDQQQKIICGLAIGWPNKDAIVNRFRTTRVATDQFVRWHN
ncbi:nitroreductase [Pelagibaculum spongiae]|uniref:Nitroreductase n=1 Tax=Pelagibaculum spongiae TaxID=2080658 RepID=A0A2V1H1C5_9GAMM|nr:nitroreductase [Pelagibaculum spongiae]PVZ72303.1 nitroreductase [Pelagibaculum spongiae]